jgi:hypothetical protein
MTENITQQKIGYKVVTQTLTAKYTSRCLVCGGRINPGETIHYQKGKGSWHAACEMPDLTDAIHLSGGSGYGCQGWTPGQVIHNPRPNGPEFLFILTAAQRYIREDGLSFGVGDEQGYIYEAAARAATDEEAAPLRARIAARQRRAAAEAERAAVARLVRDTGEFPDTPVQPVGQTVTDRQNIYGGGDWFVVGPEWIWYVQNNGSDGGDWAANNVRTGGAGAMGWRVPHTPDLEARINGFEAVLESEKDERP